MPTVTPQHLKLRPARASLRSGVALRRGTVVAAGAAVAVPGGLAGVMTAPTAHAAPTTTPAAPSAPVTLPSAPSTPSSGVVVLRYGASGALVKTLQSRLGIPADGSFGPQTRAAVRTYQASKGLQVDGIVGPLTWKSLGGFPGSGTDTGTDTGSGTGTGTGTSRTCTSYVLRYASYGEMVEVLQSRLGLGADGDFGPGTLAAVKKYQASKGLQVDGIVGPLTWKSLGGYQCDTPNPTPAPDGTETTETPATPDPNTQYTGQDVLNIAKKYLGIWYVYGGSTTAGFDCSGLTQYVYRQVGVNLPRTSRAQSQFAAGVDLNNLQVGDLVFFHSPVSHVAIYAGNGMILDASKPGTQISIHKMWNTPVKAIRVV
ncbi:peptidoglycan-binding protein [Dermacoccaceae bacterium W4C1]